MTASQTDASGVNWRGARISPVQISLHGHVGYTLRAYREAREIYEDETLLDNPYEMVPLFLGNFDKAYLFHDKQAMATFVRSGTAHYLADLDTWSAVATRLNANDIVPAAEDSYDLSRVVDSLPSMLTEWDQILFVKAGEIAIALSMAFHVERVIAAFSNGSYLSVFDAVLRENLRVDSGRATQRKLNKFEHYDVQYLWREVIAELSTAIQWRSS